MTIKLLAVLILIGIVRPQLASSYDIGLDINDRIKRDIDPFNNYPGPEIKKEAKRISIKVCLNWENGQPAAFMIAPHKNSYNSRSRSNNHSNPNAHLNPNTPPVPYRPEGTYQDLIYMAPAQDDFCVVATKDYILTETQITELLQTYTALNLEILSAQVNEKITSLFRAIQDLTVTNLRAEIYQELKQEISNELVSGKIYKKIRGEITRDVIRQLRVDGLIH